MAEVEFAGVKFTGGKMVALIVSLSTLGGGARHTNNLLTCNLLSLSM